MNSFNFLYFVLFDLVDDEKPKGSQSNHKKLGSAGLALHYAGIIAQIDTIVSVLFIQSQYIFTFNVSCLLWVLPVIMST